MYFSLSPYIWNMKIERSWRHFLFATLFYLDHSQVVDQLFYFHKIFNCRICLGVSKFIEYNFNHRILYYFFPLIRKEDSICKS